MLYFKCEYDRVRKKTVKILVSKFTHTTFVIPKSLLSQLTVVVPHSYQNGPILGQTSISKLKEMAVKMNEVTLNRFAL